MTTTQRLDQLERATSVLLDRLEWITLELLDGLSNDRFEELQRQEILAVFETAHGEDEQASRSARVTLEKFNLSCPDVIPDELSDASL